MKDAIQQIVRYQLDWTSENTEPMKRRGQLVRNQMPSEIIDRAATLRPALSRYGLTFAVEGRDGVGLKAHVPWVRVFSIEKAPSAQQGWYAVYLFHPDGAGVSLCVSHGSTQWDGGSMTVRSDQEATALIEWAKGRLAEKASKVGGLVQGLSLGDFKLAAAYEKTTAYSKFYGAGAIPDDDLLFSDLMLICELVGDLYLDEELGRSPESRSPEVASLEAAVEIAANPIRFNSKPKGQGRGLTAGERKLVEMVAMDRARAWLGAANFTYDDTSMLKPYDYLARRDGKEFIVEVKGSTGALGDIILTKNEVAAHRFWHPFNILIIVFNLEFSPDRTSVTGGEVHALEEWSFVDQDLRPVSYTYRVP